MDFFLKITKLRYQYDIVLCGKNVRHHKEYVETTIRHHSEKYNDFKNNLPARLKTKISEWYKKNNQWNIKTDYKRKNVSDNVLFAEKSIDMYSGSFSVKIDYINTMNQIMFGMSEIATIETDHFDWIRVRRTGLKNKTESSFFKLSQIEDFFKSKKIFRKNVDYKLKPLFKLVTENEKDVLENFSKYLKENEELKV